MIEGLTSIITQLERQKSAIDRALAALGEIDGNDATSAPSVLAAPATRAVTSPSLNRRSEGQKKRWAAKEQANAGPDATPKAAHRKPTFTPEGRQKLADAMKQRWAVRRAAAAVKKTGRKRATQKVA